LIGRVVVLDIAFAAGTRRISFERITQPFIEGLAGRLAMWVDHHDHEMHELFKHDSRFVLTSKALHRACPELITPQLVRRAGQVDTICCHIDFDGLCSAAKWIRGGVEPYPGSDEDARVIDTRIGEPSERAETVDRALRARGDDDDIKKTAVNFLIDGGDDADRYQALRGAAQELRPMEENALELARGYEVKGDVALLGVIDAQRTYDKTLLLLAGQKLAKIAVVYDNTTVTAAARFDSGVDLLRTLNLPGGMPTVVSLPVKFLPNVLSKLKWSKTDKPS
jgi:hypothetical protein